MERYLSLLIKFSQRFPKDTRIIRHLSSKTSKPSSFPQEIVIPNSKPFILDKLRPIHRDQLVSFLEWAYTQEPNAMSLDYPGLRERRDPDFIRDMREYCEINVDGALKSSEKLSLVILDPEGKLAAFTLGEVERVPFGVTKLEVKHTSGRDVYYTSPFFKNVTRIMNELNDGVDFSSYLTPERREIARKRNPPEILIAEMSYEAVLPAYRNNRKYGLGGKMIATIYEVIKSSGCDLINDMPVNPIMLREMEKLGFILVREMVWPYGGTVLPPVTWYNMLLPL